MGAVHSGDQALDSRARPEARLQCGIVVKFRWQRETTERARDLDQRLALRIRRELGKQIRALALYRGDGHATGFGSRVDDFDASDV